MVTVLKRPPATGPFCMDTPASPLLSENIIISSPSVWLAGGGGHSNKEKRKRADWASGVRRGLRSDGRQNEANHEH